MRYLAGAGIVLVLLAAAGFAAVWWGWVPAAADAPTLDKLLEKISAMELDLLPDNHPDVAPESLLLQITALREAEPAAG